MARYTHHACFAFGTDGEADYCEIDAKVSFIVIPGRPETPPAYDHGGLPAEAPEIDDVRVEAVNDKPVMASDQDTCDAILDQIDGVAFYADMMGSAAEQAEDYK